MTFQKMILSVVVCCMQWLSAVHAQDNAPVRFGKVTPEDFKVSAPDYDSAAGAVIVADVGISTFNVDNARMRYEINFKRSQRIKILRRAGFDAATVTLNLFSSGISTEKIQDLKAATYTLEDGKVVETRLDAKLVYSTKLAKGVVQMKFTFPNLKEGAILEYSYTLQSPFVFNLQPWEFQGRYPCLWSEYEVDIPKFLHYVSMAHGYEPFAINKTNFGPTYLDDHKWVMKNVPSLKEEPFTTTIQNYTSRIEFQLSQIELPGDLVRNEMSNWNKMSEELLNSPSFGEGLDKNNGWMDDEMKSVVRGATTQRAKAEKIYAFVRDSFNCTNHGSLMLSQPLKEVFRDRHGSEADINLLLIALLRHEGLTADPVILSTRSNGLLNEVYPLLSRFNYVICQVALDTNGYYLDASEPWLGFARLPQRCFNGYARVLDKDNPSAISLAADLIRESKKTNVIITKEEKGGLSGHIEMTPGYNEACVLREKLRNTPQEDYMKTLQAGYTGGISANNLEIDSLLRPDDPLQVGYDITLKPEPGADVIYFNPVLGSGLKENPFKAAQRKYPVEMPYVMDEVYTLSMEIPDGFMVDEMPKSARILLNGDEGFFEYIIDKDETSIQFRTWFKLNRANFEPKDYATLRDFFGAIVKKEGETIVFKRKK